MCGVVACRPGARLGCPCRLSPGLAGYPPSAHCCAVSVCGIPPCTCESSTLRENEIAPEARGGGARGGARSADEHERRATSLSPPLESRPTRLEGHDDFIFSFKNHTHDRCTSELLQERVHTRAGPAAS